MVLVDTSVWVEHLRRSDAVLQALLTREEVVTHPYVLGELALGQFAWTDTRMLFLRRLEEVPKAMDHEVLHFIEKHHLRGQGIGLVDCHLLVSCVLARDCLLWTHDQKLQNLALRLGHAYQAAVH